MTRMKNRILRYLCSTILAGFFVVASSMGFASTDEELLETAGSTGIAGSFLASRVALDDNDDEAAVQFLERAFSLDNDNDKLRQDLFAALVANGRLEEAATLVKNAKDLGRAKNLKGFVLAAEAMKKRTWKKVPDTLKEVAGIDLDKTLREITRSWALHGEGKVAEATTSLDSIQGPEWMIVIKDYHAGLMAASQGDQTAAQKRFQAVIEKRAVISVLTETYIRAVEALVRSYNKAGELAKARETLDYGLSLLPSHSPFLHLDEALEAQRSLKPLLTTPSQGMAELFYNIASALKRDGNGMLSKSYLQISNFLSPGSDVIKVGLGEVYLQQGAYEKSNSYYSEVAESSPFYRISQLEMASNLSRLEKTEEAIDTFKQLIEDDPSDITGYITLGGLYNREERYREAADVYDIAVSKLGEPERQDWNLFFRRGIAYERLKEWPKAEPNFKQALQLSKDQPEVLNYLGYSWIDQGINLEEGMEMIRKAVELRPRSGFIVDSLGWAHFRLGEYEDAVRELEKAVTLMPQDPTINDHLGDAYWKVGRKLEATFQWRIALASKSEPENPELVQRKLVEGLTEETKTEAKAQSDQ